jgi:hypothetical protein
LDHGLVALYRLGASENTLTKFYDEYTKKLEPKIPPQFTLTKNPDQEFYWYSLLGKDKNFTELQKFFDAEIENEGVDRVMAQYWPKLVEGLGGGVFHGLIELGYGFEIQPNSEAVSHWIISSGLAYTTVCYYSYGKPKWLITDQSSVSQLLKASSPDDSPVFSPYQALEILRADPFWNDDFQNHQDGFQVTMNRLNQPKYQAQLSKYDLPLLRPLYTSLEQYYQNKEYLGLFEKELKNVISTFMLTTYDLCYYTNRYSFFLLHAVTSMRALKSIIGSLVKSLDKFPENGIQAVNSLLYYWRSLVCTYITEGRPPVVKKTEPELACNRDWEDIVNELLNRIPEANDEHVMKLVYVCQEEDKEVKRDLYKELSQNIMKVIKHEKDWIF